MGPVKEGNNQSIIIRLQIHIHFPTSLYLQRKTIKKKPFKIKLSLTKRRANLLKKGDELFEKVKVFNYAFADQNGNLMIRLKIRFKEKIGNKFMHTFNSKQDLMEFLFLAPGN